MMDLWHYLVGLLPFAWGSFEFMRNALLAVLLVSPCFGIVGTMVVGNRMAFFSDVIGHSALTGIAIGVILGVADPRPVMIIFAAILAVMINIFLQMTKASSDTVIGVFFAATIALGVAILSRGGNFNKFTVYLVGDILSVTPREITFLLVMLCIVLVFWVLFGNYLALITVDPSLAYGRRISPNVIRTAFSVLVAIVVILSIRWVGILIINSLFILPAAAARMGARTNRGYLVRAVMASVAAGISGLIISFYTGSACGATIVLCAAIIYLLTVAKKYVFGKMFR
ncbi:MAG TPA: metal ABC transporter permease [Candidatus Paceibacterota bacterium]